MLVGLLIILNKFTKSKVNQKVNIHVYQQKTVKIVRESDNTDQTKFMIRTYTSQNKKRSCRIFNEIQNLNQSRDDYEKLKDRP